MTKREAMREIPAAVLKLVAQAAGDGLAANSDLYSPKERKQIKAAAKVLAQVQAGRERQ